MAPCRSVNTRVGSDTPVTRSPCGESCLTLLGPPSVTFTDGGTIVPQPGAKVLALLTYLVLESGPHSREELAGLLWGESSEDEARASLRQALKHLRDAFGEIVRSDRAVIELVAPDPLRCPGLP